MGRRSLHRSALSVLCVALLAVACAGALAGVEYSGALVSSTDPPGLDAIGKWKTVGFDVIGWDVSQNLDGSWHYVYGLALPTADEGHFILQLPTQFTAADLLNATGDFSSFSVGLFAPGPALPFLPGSIYGADFVVTAGQAKRIAFDAAIEPDFGNFYAQGDATAMFNHGFDLPNIHREPQNGWIDHKLLVPDTTAPVPDASTIVLAFAGIIPAFAMARRRPAGRAVLTSVEE